MDDQGLEFRQGLGIFLFTTAFRPALGPTQPLIQWAPGTLSLGVKRPESEADNSPSSSPEVKNAWSYFSAPPIIHLHGVVPLPLPSNDRDHFLPNPTQSSFMKFSPPHSTLYKYADLKDLKIP
jgi:hypothetical protein